MVSGKPRMNFGAVTAGRCEERADEEEFGSEFLAAVGEAADGEDGIERVACALHSGDAGVEIGSEFTAHHFGGVVFAPVFEETAGRAEMDMGINQAGEDCFAGSFHEVGIHGFLVGDVAVIDLFNFPVLHENGSVLDDVAVADKDAGVADQRSARSRESSRARICVLRTLSFAFACRCRATTKGARTATTQNFAAGRIFSSFSQRKSLTQSNSPITVVRTSAPTACQLAASDSFGHRMSLQAGHEIGGGDELRHDQEPVRETWRWESGAAERKSIAI